MQVHQTQESVCKYDGEATQEKRIDETIKIEIFSRNQIEVCFRQEGKISKFYMGQNLKFYKNMEVGWETLRSWRIDTSFSASRAGKILFNVWVH